METRSEIKLQEAFCTWLCMRHPSIMFRSMPNDIRKTLRRQDGRSHPDTIILKPVGKWHGICIEFKKSRETLFRKNGEYRQARHLKKQLECMKELLNVGYFVAFCWELDQGIEVFENYLKNGG